MTPITKRHALLALAAIGLVQTAVLIWMITDRMRILGSPQQVVLDIIPIDPRSLFQGDYVVLGYDISQQDLSGVTPDQLHFGTPVFVALAKTPAGVWKPAGATLQPPAKDTSGKVVLRGLVDSAWTNGQQTSARLNYGIESYFVPEGTGGSLQQLVGEHKLQALVAIDSSGRAAIKGLIVDGELRVEEPLL